MQFIGLLDAGHHLLESHPRLLNQHERNAVGLTPRYQALDIGYGGATHVVDDNQFHSQPWTFRRHKDR